MSEQACKVPLIELLRSVPQDHQTEWETQWADDGTPTGHAMSPVGKLCHEAADRIAALEHWIKLGDDHSKAYYDRAMKAEARLDEIAEWVAAHGAGEFEYTRTKYMADQLQAILDKREQT